MLIYPHGYKHQALLFIDNIFGMLGFELSIYLIIFH